MMNCSCVTYACLDVPVNSCNVGTGLGVLAEETGNYNFQLSFNGTIILFATSGIEGQELSVPTTVLNEQYTHELKIIAPSEEFACYKVNTYPSYTSAGYTPVPPDNDTWQWGELDVSGDTVASNLLTGDLSPIIWIDQNPTDWEVVGITHDSGTGTLDFTAIGGVTGKIIFQYKNLA